MNYNPYDLVPLILNGHTTYGRPVEFDSVITNHKNMTNAFGNIMKPSVVSTTCPDCGQGYTLSIECGDPPFEAIEINCPICRPNVEMPESPFIDPVEAGVIGEHQINPEIADIKTGIKEESSTVAERIELETSKDKEAKVEAEAKPSSTRKEKVKPKPKPAAILPKEPKAPKKPAKKTLKKEVEQADDFVDYGKKRELPKAEEMLPEVDLDLLEE